MSFAVEPISKIEIKEYGADSYTDVSDYVLRDTNLSLTVGTRLSGGTIIFDRTILNIIPNLTSQDEIKITVGDVTADTHIFTGLLRDAGDDNKDDTIQYVYKSYAVLASDRFATEVYRDDVGAGDPVEVFKDLVDKYLPELSYDGTSIPAKPSGIENFNNYRLQNSNLKAVFDFIAEYLKRIWYVDEDKKIWLVVQEFTDTGYTLETGDNIIGNLIIAVDTKRWANYVAINGKVFPVGYTGTFDGDGSTTKFGLPYRPNELTVTFDGTPQLGAIAGTDFADDADYLVDKDDKSFTFATAPDDEKSGTWALTFYSKVHDEFQDSGSINRFKRKDKTITNENIETLDQAEEIALNYLVINSEPLKIYSGKTFWNSNVLPLKKITLVDSDRNIDLKVNVIETNFRFGNKSFDVRFKLNDYDFTVVDMYEDLVNRVKRLEFNARDSGDQIAKYLFFGADFAVSINNIWIDDRDILGDGIWDIGFGNGVDNDGVWDEAGYAWNETWSNDPVVSRVINLDNIWIENFFSDWYEDDATTADWDISNKKIDFTNGEIARTKIIFKNNVAYSKATLIATGTDLGNLTFKLSADGGSNKEVVTNETQHTFSNSSTAGIMCEIVASGNATITKLEVRGET